MRPSSCLATAHSGTSALLSTESRPGAHALRGRPRPPALGDRSCRSSPSRRRAGRRSRARSGKRMSAWQGGPASGCRTMRTRCLKRWHRALRTSPCGRRLRVEGARASQRGQRRQTGWRLFSFSCSERTTACSWAHVSRRAERWPARTARCGLCARSGACVAWTARKVRWPFCRRPPRGVEQKVCMEACRSSRLGGQQVAKGYHQSTNSPSSLYPKCRRPRCLSLCPASLYSVTYRIHRSEIANRNHPKKKILKDDKNMTLACSVLIVYRKKNCCSTCFLFSFFQSQRNEMRREGAANKHAPSARLRVIVNKNVHDTYPRSAVLQKICEICEICGPAGLRPVSFLSVRLMNI